MEFDWLNDLLDSFGSESEYESIGEELPDGLDYSDQDLSFLFPIEYAIDFDSSDFGEMVGNPYEDARYYQVQTYDDTCAIVAQQGILKQFSIDLTENQLRDYAIVNGLYTDGGGTPMENVGDLLEAMGVRVHKRFDGTIDQPVAELTQNYKVIIGLDGNEIWYPEYGPNPFNWWRGELPDAGHAVWLTGINVDRGVVILNDPGNPDGQGFEVGYCRFHECLG